MKLHDTEDLVDFITRNYSDAKKIIEIGVGTYTLVAKQIKELLPTTKLIVTDTDIEKLTIIKKEYEAIEPIYDDVFKPQLNVYYEADLIYSIRPSPEMIPEILKLTSKINCDLLIRPYFDDEGGYDYHKRNGWQLTHYKLAIFYWLNKSAPHPSK